LAFFAEDFRRLPRSVDEDISGICRGGATKAGGEKTSKECEVIFASALSCSKMSTMLQLQSSNVDGMISSGYIDHMVQGTRYVSYRRERFHGGWLITLCWLLPVMAMVAGAGYVFAQNLLAKKMLSTSSFQFNRPHPKPLLTPDQAAKVARDEASPVWTEGVKAADVPKLDPHDYAAARAKSYIFPSGHHHHGLRYRHGQPGKPTATGSVGNPAAGASTPSPAGGDTPPDTTPTAPSPGVN